MKPENIKYLLDYYLREKCASDVVDGICHRGGNFPPDRISAESGMSYDDRCNELQYLEQQNAVPGIAQAVHYAPLSPRQETIVVEVARQIGDFSNRFQFQRSSSRESTDNGYRKVHFKQRHLFVPSNCGKIQIPIIREASTDKAVNVVWKTSNGTAVSGRNFIGDSGEIFFSEGESEKFIEIEIINNVEVGEDAHFQVQLFASGDTNAICRLTISITLHENLYADEKQVVENIIKCDSSARFSSVVCCLHDCVTPRTFLVGLQFLCGHADSIPEQLSYAFELTRFLLPKARREILYNVVSNFFQNLPELEDLAQCFEGLH